MIVLGITGSIGMGKTTAANLLREAAVPVQDADAVVHALLSAGGGAVDTVGKMFPEALAQDEQGRSYIDRDILGRMVFADRDEKKKLEDVLHPMVRTQANIFKRDMEKRGHAVIGMEIPLLFETGGENRVDYTVVVSAPPEAQRDRVMSRPGMTAEKFDHVVGGQMPDAKKRAMADFVVENSGDVEFMRAQLADIIRKVKTMPQRLPDVGAL